jgi:hypothetical protein
MKWGWVLFLFSSLALSEENPLDFSYKIRAVGEDHVPQTDSVFAPGLPLTSFGKDRGRVEGEVRGRAGPLSLQVTETVNKQAGTDPTSRALINQAYFDFGENEIRGSAGKKVLSYDVGYGFRPLDLIQREARLAVLPPALEGVNNLTLEHFTAQRAVSVIAANPGNGHEPDPKDDGSLSLRYYQRVGTADAYGTARYSDRFRFEAGGAFSAVPDPSIELHGSGLYQRASELTVPAATPGPQALLASDGALVTQQIHDAYKALAGFTWTFENGWSFIGEAWYDGSAPGTSDWQRLAAQAGRRNTIALLPGVPSAAVDGSMAASTRMFQQQSLTRRTALAHFGWSDPAGSGWSATLDLLRSLDDRSVSLTAAVSLDLDKVRLDAGVRAFRGSSDSVYGLLPERGILFAGAAFSF